MNNLILSMVFIVLGVSGCGSAPPISRQRFIAASEKEIVAELGAMPPVIEPASFWVGLANDGSILPNRRRLAVFQLFARHVPPGTTIAELSRMLSRPSWLSDAQFAELANFAGWIPLILTLDSDIFTISVCPESKSSNAPLVYLRIEDGASLKELSAALRLGSYLDKIGRLRILECASGEYDHHMNLITNAFGLHPGVEVCK